MKPLALSPKLFNYHYAVSPITSISCPIRSPTQFISHTSRFKSPRVTFAVRCSNNANNNYSGNESATQLKIGIGSPTIPSFVRGTKLSLSDQAFYLLAFIACTTSIAFTSLVVAAVPALHAMGRAAISFSKLADTAREELPSTMAAIRLSGMEISDLTLELNDLSQEIADGVNKSAEAVKAAEAGVRQIGSLARQQTMSMIQERANLPVISLKPVVAGAANKTSRAVDHAKKTFMGIISRGEYKPDNEDDKLVG